MKQENSGSLVLPNGAWCCSATVARRHVAKVGGGGPPLASSARSRRRADGPAAKADDTTGARDTAEDVADAVRDEDRLPGEDPQPATATAPDTATTAVTQAKECTRGTASPKGTPGSRTPRARRPLIGERSERPPKAPAPEGSGDGRDSQANAQRTRRHDVLGREEG